MTVEDANLPIPLAFQTLAEVGYTKCAHPRHKNEKCQDCGALRGRGWSDGNLFYPREPLK